MTWRVEVQPDDFDRLREDPAFAELLTIGRVANLIRSVLVLGREAGHATGTAGHRHRAATVLLLSGLLAESIPAIQRAGKHFRQLDAWKTDVQPILSDPGVSQLRTEFLNPLRNQAVFHNDAEVTIKGLELFSPQEPHGVAEGSSPKAVDSYYPLSDAVTLMYIIRNAGARETPVQFLENSLSGCVQLGERLCAAIDSVIAEALTSMGFTVQHPASD